MKRFARVLPLLTGLLILVFPCYLQGQVSVSAEGGLLQPVGLFRSNQAFNDLVKSGVALNLSVHFPAGKHLNVVATSGYWSNRLQLEDYALRQVPVLIGVEYVFRPEERLKPFISLQPGMFITSTNIPETGTRGYFGALGGVGIRYEAHGNWSVQLAGRFAYLLTQGSVTGESRTDADRERGRVLDLRYVPITLGVSYRFYREDE